MLGARRRPGSGDVSTELFDSPDGKSGEGIFKADVLAELSTCVNVMPVSFLLVSMREILPPVDFVQQLDDSNDVIGVADFPERVFQGLLYLVQGSTDCANETEDDLRAVVLKG